MKATRPTADLDRRLRALEAASPMTRLGTGASSWVALTFLNSWTDFGSVLQTGAYCRDSNGFVHLRGMVARTVAGFAIIPIANLPAGFRPSKEISFATVGNNKFARLVVLSNGNFYVDSADSATPEAFVSLDGITFDTRA